MYDPTLELLFYDDDSAVTPSTVPEVLNAIQNEQTNIGLIAGVSVTVAVVAVGGLAVVIIYMRKRKEAKIDSDLQDKLNRHSEQERLASKQAMDSTPRSSSPERSSSGKWRTASVVDVPLSNAAT